MNCFTKTNSSIIKVFNETKAPSRYEIKIGVLTLLWVVTSLIFLIGSMMGGLYIGIKISPESENIQGVVTLVSLIGGLALWGYSTQMMDVCVWRPKNEKS